MTRPAPTLLGRRGLAAALAFGLVRAAEARALPEIAIGLVIARAEAFGSGPVHVEGLPDAVLRNQRQNISASLQAGVEAGIAAVNAAGGVLGRRLRLVIETLDPDDIDLRQHSVEAARRLAATTGLIAVIGHLGRDDALPASITYAESGIVFLAPTITLGELNGHGLTNVFATVPDNTSISRQTATFVYGQGNRLVTLVRARTVEADEQGLSFLNQMGALGMSEVAQTSYPLGRTDFREILANLRAKPADVVFIAAPADDAVTIMRQGNELRIPVTYVIGGLCDVAAVFGPVSHLPITAVAPVLEDPTVMTVALRTFERNFQDASGRPGDDWVWQGADCVGLLAAAIRQTGSLSFDALLATLRYATAWEGLLGEYSFDRTGRIYSRSIAFAQLSEGVLEYDSLIPNQFTFRHGP